MAVQRLVDHRSDDPGVHLQQLPGVRQAARVSDSGDNRAHCTGEAAREKFRAGRHYLLTDAQVLISELRDHSASRADGHLIPGESLSDIANRHIRRTKRCNYRTPKTRPQPTQQELKRG